MKWTQFVMTAAGLLVGLLQPGLAVAAADDARPSLVVDVLRMVDRPSGADVRVSRAGADFIVEVAAPGLSVRKRIAPGATVTRFTGSGEDLSLSLDATGLVAVTDHRLGLTMRGDSIDALQRVRARIARSTVARRAAGLLSAMRLEPSSPLGVALGTSRALLDSALGLDRPARTAGTDGQEQDDRMTANDCWTEYTAEAIAAWIEYEQCVDSEQWWDVPGMLSCLAIYEMRAIGAFSVWASCVGLRR